MQLKPIQALLKKIEWEIQQINGDINQLAKERKAQELHLAAIKEQILQATQTVTQIVPELEIMRNQYLQKMYKKRDKVQVQVNQLTQELKQKKQELITCEVKFRLLERLLNKKKELIRQTLNKAEEKHLEELILARTRSHG